MEGSFGLFFLLPGFRHLSADNNEIVRRAVDTAGWFYGVGMKYLPAKKIALFFDLEFNRQTTTNKTISAPSTGAHDTPTESW